jgi:GT2 family glycosyltransferase
VAGGCHGTVHAVVVNYRTPDMTIQAVQALLASELPGYELQVTVVDNGSRDGSDARLRAAFPRLAHVTTPRNLGFAGGNNAALEGIIATLCHDADPDGTYLLLFNSDVVVEPDTLHVCLAHMERQPDTGIVGPKVLLPDGHLDLACRRSFPTPASGFWKLTGMARRFPNSPRLARYNLTYLDENETAAVDAVMGAFMLLRLRAVLHAGLLDERFFFYGEDLDWAYRIKAHGWRVVYYPAAVVHHLKGGTSRRDSGRMIVEFYRAMWLFYRKHYAERRSFLLNWIILAGIAGRGCLALAINALRPTGRKRVA